MTTAARGARNPAGARRRLGPGWVPNQHGAWAMILLPLGVGAVHAGARWWHLLLLVTWLVAYLAFFAAGLWLRAHRRAKYVPAVRAYAVATALLGTATVLTAPEPLHLLRWGVVYAPLLAVSLRASWVRADRSLLNDAVTVLAASLMAVVAHATVPGPVWLPGGADEAWALAAVLLGYFLGTVLYVKTMIRERGNRAMYAASVGYHAALVPAVALFWPWLAALFAALAVRAAVVPRVWPGASPRMVGFGEVAASVTLGLLLVA